MSELHPNIGEADVTDVFSPFGALESVTMPTGAEAAAGGGVGVAHVTFKSATDAATARDAMHGLELAERRIQVRLVTAAPPPNAAADPNAALLPPGSGIPAPLPNLLPSLLGLPAGSSMPLAGVDAAAAAAAAAAAGSMASGVGGAVLADGAGGGGGVSSRYVRVAHMSDPAAAAAAADGYFYDDVEDALADEASRFGHVRRCFAVRGSADGLVVVKFSDADGAAKCAAALHGRWFAGKQLMAAMVDEAEAQRLMGSGGGGDGAAPAASAPADGPLRQQQLRRRPSATLLGTGGDTAEGRHPTANLTRRQDEGACSWTERKDRTATHKTRSYARAGTIRGGGAMDVCCWSVRARARAY